MIPRPAAGGTLQYLRLACRLVEPGGMHPQAWLNRAAGGSLRQGVG